MKGDSHESVFNIALGEVLPYESKYKFTEKRGVLLNKNKQPDILVNHKDYPPVIIESSKSAQDAEKDAQNRLGEKTLDGTIIQCVIAVHIPEIFHDKDTKSIRDLLRTVQLKYCIYKPHRIPNKGWIKGTAYDISNFIKSVSITHLDETINRIETMLKESANMLIPHISQDLIKKLHQRDQQKTANSIVILWLNTLMIQDHLSEYNEYNKIKPLKNIQDDKLPDVKYYYDSWKDIQKINWTTIFENSVVSLKYLANKNNHDISKVFGMLHDIINIIDCQKYKKLINIGAELFPKLSVDRKTAAAFYTNQTTAEFLANLTINEKDIDKDIFDKIKIVDMACGTGTLLRAGYNVIRTNFEKYHIDDKESLKKIHTDAIEKGLIGLDIFPISTHLTASSITMMGYGDPYNEMNIGMMPVGGTVGKTGSLEYLDSNANYDLLTPNQKIKGIDTKSTEYNQIIIKNNDIDYILMNPPYSKPGGENSTFNITGMSDNISKTCQNRWGKLLNDIPNKPAKKSAGMAASFLVLASLKLKPGGRLGFVLPLTMAFGDSWSVTRDYFTRNFENIIASTIAGGHKNQRLSADTKMNEMLLIATKSKEPHKPCPIKCITLTTNFDHGTAMELSRTVQSTVHKVDKNTTVYPILFGDDNIGNCTLFHTDGKEPWSPLGATNDHLSQFTTNLKKGIIKTKKQKYKINMKNISDMFDIGPMEVQIGHIKDHIQTGLFEMHPIGNDLTADNTSLWHIKSNIQYSILIKPTHKGILVKNDIKELKKITDHNSILFHATRITWTSQKLLGAMSIQHIMGGSSWISLQHKDKNISKVASLWFNSIFGMSLFWSQMSRTQAGRSVTRHGAFKKLTCPDFTTLPKNKILQASKKLDELKTKTLLPVYRMHLDIVRHQIDQAIIDLFDWQISDQELADIRNQLVNEPSIFTGEQTNLDPDEVIQYSICQDIILDGKNEPITILSTNKNVIIFNPNVTKLNDQVIKIPYSTIKSVQYKKDTIQLVLYDPPTDKRSKKYWNNTVGQITDLPINQLEKLCKNIQSNIKN